MFRPLAFCFAASIAVSACAIHPLPENVTRNTTFDIVRKIRCEARQALDDLTVELLRGAQDAELDSYAAKIESGEINATDLLEYRKRYNLKNLPELSLAIFRGYTLSAATFDFEFMITESNENNVDFNLAVPLVTQTFSLNGKARADFARQSTRKFLLTNSFYELHKIPRSECAEIAATVGNYIYPITGKIGIKEVFKTFVLVDTKNGPITKGATKEQLFTDTVKFSTTVEASVNPKITLNAVDNPSLNVLRVPDAAGTFGARREDIHQVSISLARGDVLESFAQAERLLTPAFLKSTRLSAKQKALAIAQQNRVNFFFINQEKIYNRLNIRSPFGF